MGSSSSKRKTSSNTGKAVKKRQKRNKNGDTDTSSDDDTEEESGYTAGPNRVHNDRSPRPPAVLKKTLIPDISVFDAIDTHAKTAPENLKSTLQELAIYLCSEVEDPLYKVRAFYIWITHNISYDVDGYFGDKDKLPCDADSVLLSGLSVCEGYSNVMFSLCREGDIPCKIISGYAKGFGTTPDTEFSIESETDHSWNAVFLGTDWYLIDSTWGAGHIDENGKFQQKFTEFYFLTNPSEFISSHFPYIDKDTEESRKWQLLKNPLTAEEFEKNVKVEEMGFALKVKPFSHPNGHIDVDDAVDIVLKCSGKEKVEFTTALYMKQGAKHDEMKQQVYSYVLERKLFVHVQPPLQGKFRLMIYGRRSSRDTSIKFEKLIDYAINYDPKSEIGVYSPYPEQQTQYGASPDYRDFGFKSDAKRKPIYCSDTGTIFLSYRIKKGAEAITDLEFSDNKKDLSNFTMAYTNKNDTLYIAARMPYVGFYKLSVKAKRLETHSATIWGVIDSLIECTNVNDRLEVFPKYYSKAIVENCQLLEPVKRDLPANSVQRFRVLAPGQEIVMVEDTKLKGKGDLFEGNVQCPKAGAKMAVYCSKNEQCYLEGIYEFKVV